MPKRRYSDSSASDTESDSDSSTSSGSSAFFRSTDSDSSEDDEARKTDAIIGKQGSGWSTSVVIEMALALAASLLLLAWWMRTRESDSTQQVQDIAESEPTSSVSTSGEAAAAAAAPAESSAKTSTASPSISPVKLKADNSTSEGNDSCFPLSSDPFPGSGAPSQSREAWWCQDSELFGFLGFSYPLEIADCSDPSNGFDKINQDLKQMKADFGASMVRPYAVSCRTVTVWENLVKACVENKMGMIAQVWWGFDDQDLWKETEASIFELFETSSFASVAPFVVHSVSFGSKPIGDGVLGDEFIPSLSQFRSKIEKYGVGAGISEHWDREQMSSGGKVTGIGAEVLKNTDIAHLHIMPYYHPDSAPLASDAWPYAKKQIEWARINLEQPTFVTQSMWSSKSGGSHGRGAHDEECTPEGYNTYWSTFASNCDFFKEQQVGWFVHVFDDSMEPYFGMVDSGGKSKIDGWKPDRC